MFVFAASTVATPASLVAMGDELGINLTQRGGLETARAMVLAAVVLVSGFLADKWGRKWLLCSGPYIMAFGLAAAAGAGTYSALLLALGATGAGCGCIEALVSPLVAELHPDDPGRHLNAAHAFFSFGVVVSVLVYGALLSRGVSWRLSFAGCAAAAAVVGLVFQTSSFPAAGSGGARPPAAVTFLRRPAFWLLAVAMFLSAGAEGGLTFWSSSFIQRECAGLPGAGALGVASFGGMMALGRLAVGRLAARTSLKRILLVSAVAGTGISACVTQAQSLWGAWIGLGLSGLCVGCFWPTILALAAETIAVGSATLFALLATAGIGGFGILPWTIGAVGDLFGLRVALWLIPAVLAGTAAALVPVRARAADAPSGHAPGAEQREQ